MDFDLTQSLRGKALLVPLAVTAPVKADGEPIRWTRVQDPSGVGDVIANASLRMDANSLAEMEDRWGSIATWLVESQRKPWKTIRDTFAICLERDPKDVGVALIESMMDDYSRAIGVAYAIANGVDPTLAIEAVTQATVDIAAGAEFATEQMSRLVTPGKTGSQAGSVSGDPSKSSGG